MMFSVICALISIGYLPKNEIDNMVYIDFYSFAFNFFESLCLFLVSNIKVLVLKWEIFSSCTEYSYKCLILFSSNFFFLDL